jgi:oxalate decarboxylase/phosphoglucose isomerase-like protein (cupin superfamily)
MIPMIFKELSRIKHIREDGWLSELVSMNYDDIPFNCVHSYLVSIGPGKTRARHYHRKKDEWLAIASGKILLLLEDVNSKKKEKIILDACAPDYKMIYVPFYIAHAIKNISIAEASVIVFSRLPEDKDDTFSYEVKE